MFFIHNETKEKIREYMNSFTDAERGIAMYFLENEKITDFSSKRIANLLYVSDATLSRFAKKCGFKGYRDFIYCYEKSLSELSHMKIDDNKMLELFYDGYIKAIGSNMKKIDITKLNEMSNIIDKASKLLIAETDNKDVYTEKISNEILNNGKICFVVKPEKLNVYSKKWINEDTVLLLIVNSKVGSKLKEDLEIIEKRGCKILLIAQRKYLETVDLDSYINIEIEEQIKLQPNFSLDFMISLLCEYYILRKK